MDSAKQISEIMKILREHEARLSALEGSIIDTASRRGTTNESGTSIDKLAKKIAISTGKLKEVFDIEDNQLTLLKTIGDDEKEKIQNTALIVLLVYKYLHGINELLAKEIRRNAAENSLPINNFATYINELSPSLIRRKGKAKSPRTSYRLVTLGEARAKELLRKLCE
jgi:hypothetical protein